MQRIASKLNWTRMLGFEQIADTRQAMQEAARLNAKVGTKLGGKVGGKVGTKEGIKA